MRYKTEREIYICMKLLKFMLNLIKQLKLTDDFFQIEMKVNMKIKQKKSVKDKSQV